MSDWLPIIVYDWATARNQLGPEDARTLSDLLQKCNPNKDLQAMPIVELRKCLWEMCNIQDVTSAGLNTLWRVRNLADKFSIHWPQYDSATPAELELIKVSARVEAGHNRSFAMHSDATLMSALIETLNV